jgi:hypothetical protein
MNEAEWQRCLNVEPMLRELHKSFGGDKLRLFGCVVYRRVCDSFDAGIRDLLDATEAWATSSISIDQWQAKWDRYPNLWSNYDFQLLRDLVISTYSNVISPVWLAAMRSRQYALSGTAASLHKGLDKTEKKWQAVALRDLYGNPFRPVAFPPSWRTDTALTLARQMYDSRDFGAMPILADALQDAGCEDASILDHCRGEGSHVRGCWVVDLVLGKE